MAAINIQVLVTNECFACVRVLQQLHQLRDKMPGVVVEVFNLDERAAVPEELRAVIVPATYVNGRLFAYGEFEPVALMNAIRRFIKTLPQTQIGDHR